MSPETAVAILGATICSRLPATKPQIFPQDPPLVDVCALRDDADPMRWCQVGLNGAALLRHHPFLLSCGTSN